MANSNPGNFANDKEKASEAGHKGGQTSHGTSASSHDRETDHKGSHSSGGNFAQDREKASEAGRKGGSK
jgi:general stress protein YciG